MGYGAVSSGPVPVSPGEVRTNATVPVSVLVSSRVAQSTRHSQVIENVRQTVNAKGQTILQTNRYTALGQDLNRPDGRGGWTPSEPRFALATDGGIVGTGGNFEVRIAADLATRAAVEITTSSVSSNNRPSQVRMNFLGVNFFDPDSGKSQLLGTVTNSTAILVSSNRVVFRDAVSGLKCSVVYEFGSKLSQYVVLEEQLPEPPAGFGPQTRLEVFSEIVDSLPITRTLHLLRSETNAVKRAQLAEPDYYDEQLRLGVKAAFGPGQAFLLNAGLASQNGRFPVAKRVIELDSGRRILVESVELGAPVRAELKKLPARTKATSASYVPAMRVGREWPAPLLAEGSGSSRSAVQLAGTPAMPKGFAMDWEYLDTEYTYEQFTFSPGETYLVCGGVNIGVATFGSGAVVKYEPGSSITILDFFYTAPMTFTSKGDNTIGQTVGSGPPTRDASPMLYLLYPQNWWLTGCEFRNAQTAVWAHGGSGNEFTIQNCTFLDSDAGVVSTEGVWDLEVSNSEFCNVYTPMSGYMTQSGITYCTPPAGTIAFVTGPYGVGEGEGSMQVAVRRSDGTGGRVTVPYYTANGTAMAGSDYSGRSDTLTWEDGDSEDKYIAVPILEDSTYEGPEYFSVHLGEPTEGGATLGYLVNTVVWIGDNDSPPSGGGCVPAPADMVGWWPGDNSTDDLAGTHTGSPQPPRTPLYPVGKVAQAFEFDGVDDFVEIGDTTDLNPTTDLTLEAWVYNTGNAGWGQDIISKDGEYYDRQYILNIGFGQRFRAHVWHPGGGLSMFDGNTTVQLNNWYHVAMTYDGANLCLYVNGMPDGSIPATGPIVGTGQPVRIGGGAPAGAPQYVFRGLIDEPAIYRRALSASEISSIYAAGAAGKCKGTTPVSVSVTATDATAREMTTGQDNGMFTFTRSSPGPALTVNFTVGGTATSDSDYTPLGSSVTFGLNQTMVTLPVTVQDDTVVESDETVVVTLNTGSGYTVGSPASATVTIQDNDAAVSEEAYVTGKTLGSLRNDYGGWVGMRIAVGASPVTVTALGRMMAQNNTGTHTVKMVKASDGQDVPGGSVSIAMSGGTPGQFRYAPLSSPVVLAAGATYYVVSQETDGADLWHELTTKITTTSVAQELSGVFLNGSGNWQPNGGAGDTYVPVDFKYQITPQTALVAHWAMDEGTGTTVADSAGSHVGTLFGGASWITPGQVGSGALEFNGVNGRMTFSPLPLTTTFTVAMWIHPIPGSDNYGTLLAEGQQKGIWYEGAQHKVNFYYNGSAHLNQTELTENQWHHVVVVRNGSTVTFYLDGVADGTASGAVDFNADTMGDDPGSETFKGRLDDVRVYNYALSPTEVAALFDSDGDHLADAWELKHFGDLSQDANGTNGDYDGDGQDNLTEFQAGTDPNTINFLATLPAGANDHVQSSTVQLQLALSDGHPTEMTYLINPTELVWGSSQTYGSSMTVTLPAADGRYEVWIGARGRAGNASTPTWQKMTVWKDTHPPEIVLTEPVELASVTSMTTPRPMIQLKGYSREPLSAVRFSLNGASPDEEGFVTKQHFDTTLGEFTQNDFQCYDIELAPNANNITLKATDLAGNMTTLNLTVTFDYSNDTTPPTVDVYWPQNGAQISGEQFTLRGMLVDDPTATVTVQVTGGGTVSEGTGLVERNGLFWVEDLPLHDGNNIVHLTATDAKGNVTTWPDFTVTKSAVTLTIDDVTDDKITRSEATLVTGTVSDSTREVWVNGVPATFDPPGGNSWRAEHVPLPEGGTFLLEAVAHPNGTGGTFLLAAVPNPSGTGGTGAEIPTYASPGNPGPSTSPTRLLQKDFKSRWYVQLYFANMTRRLVNITPEPSDGGLNYCFYYGTGTGDVGRYLRGPMNESDVLVWMEQAETEAGRRRIYSSDWGRLPENRVRATPNPNIDTTIANTWTDVWPPATWDNEHPLPNGTGSDSLTCFTPQYQETTVNSSYVSGPPPIQFEVCNSTARGFMSGADGWLARIEGTRGAVTVVKLWTGGKALAKRRNLFSITASASRLDPFSWLTATPVGSLPAIQRIDGVPALPAIAPEQINVGGLGSLGSDGMLYKALPDNEVVDISPRVAGVNYYNFTVTPQKHKLKIHAGTGLMVSAILEEDRVVPDAQFCVGQKIGLTASLSPAVDGVSQISAVWLLPGIFVNFIEEWPNEAKKYLTLWDLTWQRDTHAWWLTGGKKSLRCDWHLEFSNGQSAKISGLGKLDMHRPTMANFAPNGPFFPFITEDRRTAGRPWLQLGDEGSSGGMDFSATVLSQFDGKIRWTQLINQYRYRDDLPIGIFVRSTGGQFAADGGEFYLPDVLSVDLTAGSPGILPFGDGPGNPVGLSLARSHDIFKTYLRFLPTGSESIWVTLGRVDWSWEATASCPSGSPYTSSNWIITSSNIPAPAYQDDYTIPMWVDKVGGVISELVNWMLVEQ